MIGKNNQYLLQQKKGQKFEKYSIKKLKVGAASVLVGAGFFSCRNSSRTKDSNN